MMQSIQSTQSTQMITKSITREQVKLFNPNIQHPVLGQMLYIDEAAKAGDERWIVVGYADEQFVVAQFAEQKVRYAS